ncbi:sensor histidine kinase [Nocardia nova]|uniref:sensor histidine kinase n=1 Tax=Nocardia nova TaxID=37330 RepID=UPI00046D8E71|nr:sensor histidine kinase [Nocardia nova]
MESRRWAFGRDVVLTLVVTVIQVGAGHAANAHQADVRSLDGIGYALLVAGPVLLLLRRRYPRSVFVAVLAVTAGYLLAGYGYGPIFVSLIIAFLTAASRGSRWYTYPLVPLGYLLMVWPVPALRGQDTGGWPVIGILAWLFVLIGIAEGIRQRQAVLLARSQRAEAARRNAAAERARELAEREQRADRERLAIARELHDVLAHSLSLINVQSSVALELFDRKPEQAATALSAIKEVSRDALEEVHSLLRSIRAGAGTVAAPTSPAVGIGDLESLLAPTRAAGTVVHTRITGTPHRLPVVVDVAAARIVQESLTNVLRHAPGTEATVAVDYSPTGLCITVDNDGPPNSPQSSTTGGGNGIPGMIERAHALGGELSAAARTDGGFRVEARLPIPATAAAREHGSTLPSTPSGRANDAHLRTRPPRSADRANDAGTPESAAEPRERE